jgi:hypothetical protein
MKHKHLITEQVVLGNGKFGYTFPDTMELAQCTKIIWHIEASKFLSYMVQDQDSTAQDIWSRLSAFPELKDFIDKNKHLTTFRISAVRKGKDGFEKNAYKPQRPDQRDSTRPIDLYDVTAQTRWKAGKSVPSFKEFFDPSKTHIWRTEEVSGATTKQEPPKEI